MTVRAKVLRSFPYARDGIHARVLEEGEIEDFPDDSFGGFSNKDAPGGPHLERVSDDTPIEDARNPAEPNWDGVGDNEMVGIIEGKTGERVNAGDYSHAELVATTRSALGYDKPARRRGVAERALAGKQGDDRAMGGFPSPTRPVLTPNSERPASPPPPDPKNAQVKVVDGTPVKVDTKKADASK
jgi:hypothetical protein